MAQKNIFKMFTSESFFCLFPLNNCSSEVLAALVEQLLTCCNTGSHTHLRFMSTVKFTQSCQFHFYLSEYHFDYSNTFSPHSFF